MNLAYVVNSDFYDIIPFRNSEFDGPVNGRLVNPCLFVRNEVVFEVLRSLGQMNERENG